MSNQNQGRPKEGEGQKFSGEVWEGSNTTE